jgi:hypothetical protein
LNEQGARPLLKFIEREKTKQGEVTGKYKFRKQKKEKKKILQAEKRNQAKLDLLSIG